MQPISSPVRLSTQTLSESTQENPIFSMTSGVSSPTQVLSESSEGNFIHSMNLAGEERRWAIKKIKLYEKGRQIPSKYERSDFLQETRRVIESYNKQIREKRARDNKKKKVVPSEQANTRNETEYQLILNSQESKTKMGSVIEGMTVDPPYHFACYFNKTIKTHYMVEILETIGHSDCSRLIPKVIAVSFVFFFSRIYEGKEDSFAVTTNYGRHVVRNYLVHSFMTDVAHRISGDDIGKIEFRKVQDQRSFGSKKYLKPDYRSVVQDLSILNKIVESYQANIDPECLEIEDPFPLINKKKKGKDTDEDEKREVKYQATPDRITFLTTVHFSRLPNIFSWMVNQYQKPSSDKPNWMSYWRCVKKKGLASDLDQKLIDQLFEYFCKGDFPVHMRVLNHRYIEEFIESEYYSLIYSQGRTKPSVRIDLNRSELTLDHIFSRLMGERFKREFPNSNPFPSTFRDHQTFTKELKKVRVEFQNFRMKTKKTEQPLINYIDCEVKREEPSQLSPRESHIEKGAEKYVKVASRWYRLSYHYPKILEKNFYDLLSRCLQGVGKECQKVVCPKPWRRDKHEFEYNQKYLNDPGYILGDHITTSEGRAGIEFFDLLYLTEKKTAVIAVKEGLDQSVRDVCNQALVSARCLRSQPDFLENYWKVASNKNPEEGSEKPYRIEVAKSWETFEIVSDEKDPHTGKRGLASSAPSNPPKRIKLNSGTASEVTESQYDRYKKLFDDNVVFVIAMRRRKPKDISSNEREISLSKYVEPFTPAKLRDALNPMDIRRAVGKTNLKVKLSSRDKSKAARLIFNKMLEKNLINKKKCRSEKLFGQQTELEELLQTELNLKKGSAQNIYRKMLKCPIDSVIAKLTMLETCRKIESMGWGFEICQIPIP